MQSQWLAVVSFVFCTGLVGLATWLLTRRDRHDTSSGYFLAGRALTGGYIAGSLMLTNLSTEQLVGLNGAAFADGMAVMAWEVIAGLSLVVMGLYFLPRYLKSGIATVPQFLEERYAESTRAITSLIFIVAYAGILLPIILYTGAKGLIGIFDLNENLGGIAGMVGEWTGLPTLTVVRWSTVWLIGIIGSIYAIVGGLRTVAVSDTLNGFGLLLGGVLVTWLGLQAINPGNPVTALAEIREAHPEKFNSLGGADSSVPWQTLFTGVLLLNLFYWCTNQQIIQRTFGASTLSEGQRGVLFAGWLKVMTPLILVLPGIIAFYLLGHVAVDGQRLPVQHVVPESGAVVARSSEGEVELLQGQAALNALEAESFAAAETMQGKRFDHDGREFTVQRVVGPGMVVASGPDGGYRYLPTSETGEVVPADDVDRAYGALVREVLPPYLRGFFAAVVVGAILSSFNSALNSTATLFSLGVYRDMIRPNAGDREVIRSGKIFGWIVALTSMTVAPLLAGQESIFAYLQKMNGLYFIPIFSVVLLGLLHRRIPAVAANWALVLGFVVIAFGYFVPPFSGWVEDVHEFHFLGFVFAGLIGLMLIVGLLKPLPTPWEHRHSGDVDMTPWRWAWPVGLALAVFVLAIYVGLADFSTL